MNKPSNPAQPSEQTKPKILKPDFSHRIPEYLQEATPFNLNCIVDNQAHQAISALRALSGCFAGDNDGLSDEVIFWSIESVIQTIQDIQATVSAYHKSNKAVNHE